jgi:adenylate kinase
MLRGKSSGRTDDQDINKVNNRIKVYKKETVPVATYYEEQGKLNTIVGVGSVDNIFSDISEVIERLPH